MDIIKEGTVTEKECDVYATMASQLLQFSC